MNQSKLSQFFSTQKSDKISEPTKIKKVRPAEKINDNIYSLYFDGCSKGNPGHAGAGAVLYLGSNEIWAKSIYVGNRSTNNVAEYSGMILGMNEAITKNITELSVYGDSMLVIKQMRGEYKVTSPAMQPFSIKRNCSNNVFQKYHTHMFIVIKIPEPMNCLIRV